MLTQTSGAGSIAGRSAAERTQNRFIDSLKKTAFIVGTGLIAITAARNSITWHLQKFWGASGDFWQRSWHFIHHDIFHGDNYNLSVYGTFLCTFLVFWLFNGFLLFVYATGIPSFMLKYRIQPDVDIPINRRMLLKAIGICLFNQIVLQLVIGILCHHVLVWRGCPLAAEEIPTFAWVVFEVSICVLMEEIFFYYSHRLLHHPIFYKRIHKIHHEWTSPISIVGIYAHPVEHILSNLLPPFMGPLLLGSHLATAWLWYSIALMSTSISHCGFHLPFFPSPEAHDFHHLKFNQCYGVLGVLDRLHGTDKAFRASKAYERHFMMLSLVPMREQYPDVNKGQKAESQD